MPRTPTALLEDAAHLVEGMMQHDQRHDTRAQDVAQPCRGASRYFGARDRMLVGFVFLTIVRAPHALAGEPMPPALDASIPNAARPAIDAPPSRTPTSSFMLPLPSSYQAVDLPVLKTFSAAEFRPRGRSILERDARAGDAEDAPMLRGTTVWQRLSDYRTRDRIRVVTLWETGGSSVSLQAGRKGDPSLQWTSRLMNRGGATRGLLDQVFSTSVGGVARSLHLGPHSAGTDTPVKPSKPLEANLGGTGSAK